MKKPQQSGGKIMKQKSYRRQRRFWIKPGRTSAWWDNFVNCSVMPEDNFRMSKSSFYKPCHQLNPYLERQATNMRSPVDVPKQVALTLYYLSDEGQLRKTANAFGLSRSCVSIIILIQRVTFAITMILGPHYIKLPLTEHEVQEKLFKVLSFYNNTLYLNVLVL